MSATTRNIETSPKIGFFKKIWEIRKVILLEPLLICAILPLGMLRVTNLNFNLEKACRVNLGYDPNVCVSILDKQHSGVDCSGIVFDGNNATNMSYVNITIDPGAHFNYDACKAELESQRLVTRINAIREPIASIFPIIVILFAGGWSDRTGLRKPCMVFPIIGELISLTAHIISSIWMNTIPMEVCAIIEKVVPSMFGGQTLLIIGVLSYITETTSEDDRAFRFGIFTVIVNITLLIGLSLSGIMFGLLGYVNIYILASSIFLVATAYLLFFIPEINSKPNMIEIYPYTVSDEWSDMPVETAKNYYSFKPKVKNTNAFLNFFDPTSAYDCFKVFLRKRDFNGRVLLILFVILSLLISAPDDRDYIYMFTMRNLDWNGDMYSMYLTFNMIINLLGTIVMTALFVKVFKMSNALAGFFASVLSIFSNLFTAYATTTTMFYVGQIINLFSFCKEIMINAIIASYIDKEEIGRVYSVQGVIKAVCGLLLPLLYAKMYTATIESSPGAIFLLSEVFIVPSTILFGVIYVMVKHENRRKQKEENDTKSKQNGESPDVGVSRL